MVTVADVLQFVHQFAPPELAEPWDNTGLLIGNSAAPVQRIMTCLTVTPESVAEAIAEQADLIVAHHPIPFRPVKRITDADTTGKLLLEMIAAGIAVISPHTSFDSATAGINQRLAERLGCTAIRPLVPAAAQPDGGTGSGRVGELPTELSLESFLDQCRAAFGLSQIRFVGRPDARVHKVALACGSGGSFLEYAIGKECQVMVTGEATFHTCLEAQAQQVGLVLLGHFASERFALEELASILDGQFADASCWCSRNESDPIRVFRADS